jgi:hypothetical protein
MAVNQKVAFWSAFFNCHPDLGVTDHDPGDRMTRGEKKGTQSFGEKPCWKVSTC